MSRHRVSAEHFTHDVGVVENREICVIGVLGVKRQNLQDDLRALQLSETVQINFHTSMDNAINTFRGKGKKAYFLGWCLEMTCLPWSC